MASTIRFNLVLRAALAICSIVGLGVPQSAWAQIAVLSNTVEERIAAPGESYRGTIVILNTTAEEQRVRIYQTDYTFSADGTSDFGEVGSSARSNAAWVSSASQQMVIPARGQVPVTYTVRVPARADLSGSYWSTIMVEGTDGPSPTSRGGTVGLGTVVRYAVQVATHIQATGSRKIEFSVPRTGNDTAGHHTLDVVLKNVGERAYRPVVWVELYDGLGELRGKAEQTRGLLYPGTSIRQSFAFADIAAGSYKAVVFADTGDDAIFATQYKLVF